MPSHTHSFAGTLGVDTGDQINRVLGAEGGGSTSGIVGYNGGGQE